MNTVMLALSTFRQSAEAIELAFEKAAVAKTLVVVFVVDINLSRYLMVMDVGLFPGLKEKCEDDLLKEHKEQAGEIVQSIVEEAGKRGISVRTHITTGRFGPECMKVVEKEKPEVILTTRSDRPAWMRNLFGSPVDYLIGNAGCPVVEA